MSTQTLSRVVAWGVYYCPTKKGTIFAGLKSELQQAFKSQDDAHAFCYHLNQCGALDELHSGYRVYSMHWIPVGVMVK